jgi:hypothetical protein
MAASKLQKNQIHEQASALLGLGTETIGKTEARQKFLPLVRDLKMHPRTVEITEQDNPVAVLLSYNHYVALISQLSKLTRGAPKKKPDLMGSVTIVGDLEAASKRIGEEFRKSIKRSAANL